MEGGGTDPPREPPPREPPPREPRSFPRGTGADADAESGAGVDANDAAAVWSAVRERTGRGAAAAWLTHFSLADLDPAAGAASLLPRPGLGGGGRSLATEPRLRRLSELVTAVVGVPVRVVLAAPGGAGGGSDGGGGAGPGGPNPNAAPGREHELDRREALALPLVREVLDVFPEASLVGARRRPDAPALPPPEPGAADEAAAEGL